MKTTYELRAEATCPVDGKKIQYEVAVTLTTSSLTAMIEVERLIPAVERATASPIMQEALTATLAVEIETLLEDHIDVEVRTVGTHSGVRITCTA